MNTTPTLDDDRVAAMRSGVMSEIDQSVRHRGRSLRRAAGGTLAAAVVLGVGAAGFASLITPDSPSVIAGASNDSAGADERAVAPDMAAMPEVANARNGVVDLSGEYAADADREVITIGSVSLEVTDARKAATGIATWVEDNGGRIDSRYDDEGRSSLSVRVPAATVGATVEALEEFGDVTSTSIQREDVTSTARDLDARIESLTISTKRLQKIMDEATDSDQLIKAESALTQRQAELEGLQAQRSLMADQVALSTLSIEVVERAKAESVEPGGFVGGLRDGWNALVSMVNGVVTTTGVLVPWLGLALVLGALWWLTRRVVRRRG